MMRIAEALEAFRPLRGDALIVPGRGGRYWVEQTDNEKLDAPLGDPAMGGHAGFGLGLALARPERKTVLFDSEGDILMSLGMLATIAEQAPANFYHFLLDNECYGTTGGQPVPNAKNIAYDKLALAAGYPRAHAFSEIGDLTRELPAILQPPGPVFVWLKVYPEVENEPIGRRRRWQTRGRDQVLADLRGALGVAAS
jgi:phosphonopyruvate decarboxylase